MIQHSAVRDEDKEERFKPNLNKEDDQVPKETNPARGGKL